MIFSKFTSVLNNYQQCISGIIVRDGNLIKSDAKKCQHTPKGRDAIWVVVDRLSKVAHFIPYHSTNSASDLTSIYMREIVGLHGVPKTIVSDRDAKFVSKFSESLQSALETNVILSTAFHPQTDGQSELTIQTLEDMLRSCVFVMEGVGRTICLF